MPEVMQQQQPAQQQPQQPQMPPQGMDQQQQAQVPQMPQQGMNFLSQENLSDERDVAFENAFRDAAYSIFNAKYPELTPQVVTFKVIKSKIDTGDAVGAFIVSLGGETVYIPSVMSDNMLKPMEILYSKKLDRFMPFNKDWLGVIASAGQQSMGEGVKAPDSLPRDVDISTMIYPPLDGRISMGMDLSEINHLDILAYANNSTKEQYKNMIMKDRGHLKFASSFFDLEDIKRALAPHREKVAAAREDDLLVFDTSTPASVIREHYRDTSYAMTKIAREGMIYKDNRANLNQVLTHDSRVILESPSHSGTYVLYESDGSFIPAIVITNPNPGSDSAVPCMPYSHVQSKTKPIHILAILPDGKWFEHHGEIAATPTSHETFRAAGATAKHIHDVVYGDKAESNAAKSNVTFIRKDGDVIQALLPKYVDLTEITKDKHKKYLRVNTSQFKNNQRHIYGVKEESSSVIHEILHADTNTGKVLTPTTKLTVVPKSFKLLKLGDKISGYESARFLKDPSQVLSFLQSKINSKGGKKVKVQNTGMGEFAINNRPVGDWKAGTKKLAQDYAISMDDSLQIFKKISSDHTAFSFSVWPHEKRANMFSGTPGTQMTPEAAQQMQAPQQQAQAPQQQQMQAPQQQPQDPQMMQMGMQSQDPNLYSLGVLNSLAQNPDILELLSVYNPVLEKALDSVGRMLLTFWIKGSQAKSSLGEEAYFSAEDSLRTVFKGVGSLMLKLQRQAATAPDQSGA